jgi:hypothetical protein
VQCVSELLGKDGQPYSVRVEESERDELEQDEPEVVIMLVQNERNTCFHIAVARTNTNIDDAKAVCSQAVLYRTKEDDPSLYFAVYDSCTQTVYFCLCDPFKQTFEDISQYSMQNEAGVIAERLKAYTDSNARVLC